ncbi:glycoside hydrolase family 66 protein [Cohnella sp.]|uniref:glycoside hydrolase family 66 protein n=1 Tax=Cohnella sp. TaxID=1883426 RepID=UPI003562B3A0
MTWKCSRGQTTVIVFLSCFLVLAVGCTKKQDIKAEEVVKVQAVMESVSTDKAAYNPGESVKFTLQLKLAETGSKVRVQYRHLGKIIGNDEHELDRQQIEWSWEPPTDDGKGYMAEVFIVSKDGVTDHLNIGVDISSDWAKFPRYGYLADFPSMSKEEITKVIDRLNRFHINGIQFYDWQYKHHEPIKMDADKPAAQWNDIANRPVALETVNNYIELAHDRNMKAMNYNLLFGAYENADKEGVKKEWGLFKGPAQTNQDKHPLPDSWASDIMLYDPQNTEWQDYLIGKEVEVFKLLPFDGWHVDQLGDRGSLWNAASKKVRLPEGYVSFLKAAKQKLDVDYVMNAVGQYGQAFLAAGAPLDFLYTEVWSGHPKYRSLKEIIDQNSKFSKNQLNTVLAGYMNYDLSNSPGEFNTPGVLLTDAVIFASGGSHLELGENMLSKEYFPHKNLSIPLELEEQLIRYYDFLVAYQNVLRDGMEESELQAEGSGNIGISTDAEQGKIWSFAKRKNGIDIVHFINFLDATTMEWNDAAGTQAEPSEQRDIAISFQSDRKVSEILFASPDYYNGSPVQLQYEEKDGKVTLKLPRLKYWDMITVNYEK